MFSNPRECPVCHNTFHLGMQPYTYDCPHCKDIEAQKIKDKYLEGLKKLSYEERMEKLEEGLYDLQRRPPVYVPPPVY